jgi:hypothetical protein
LAGSARRVDRANFRLCCCTVHLHALLESAL